MPCDPGLQRERTAMAWTRTSLALLANALVVLRAGAISRQWPVLALGTLLLSAAGGAVACGVWRARTLAHGSDPRTPLALVVATVAVTWAASVAGIAAILAIPA